MASKELQRHLDRLDEDRRLRAISQKEGQRAEIKKIINSSVKNPLDAVQTLDGVVVDGWVGKFVEKEQKTKKNKSVDECCKQLHKEGWATYGYCDLYKKNSCLATAFGKNMLSVACKINKSEQEF